MSAIARDPRPWHGLLIPAVASAIVFAILVGLGLWQLERKAWKDGLISAIATRAYGPPGEPVAEAAWPRWRAADDEFRRIRLAGAFLHDREITLNGLMEERRGVAILGYYVFTPFRLADGATIMVNRGFVTPERRDPASRSDSRIAGETAIVGLVRAPERRGWFLPANQPARGEWFVRDIEGMAAAQGLVRVAPFFVDADAAPNPGGWPRGGQTRMTLPNDHLGYALTWFGLAATLVGVFGTFAWRRVRPASGDDLQPDDAGHDQADAAQPQGLR